MAKTINEEIHKKWKVLILEQRSSGFSINSWCHQNNILTHRFIYWQRKLFPKPPLDRSDFTEIAPEKDFSLKGIVLEYRGFNIHINRHFEASVLQRCIEVLKKC